MAEGSEKRGDLFDRIMCLPGLRIFNGFYLAHKQILLYLFFGVLAVILNLALFAGFAYGLGLNELVNNVICWIICVLVQFFTNRTWVFETHTENLAEFFRQMAEFFGGRLFTLVVEEAILLVFITWLECNAMVVKSTGQILVILLNYLISKFWVFKT